MELKTLKLSEIYISNDRSKNKREINESVTEIGILTPYCR